MSDERVSREEWNALSPDEQYQAFYWRDFAVNSYEHVLLEIPPCPHHGHLCTAHAITWVRNAKVSRLELSVGDIVCPRFVQRPAGHVVGILLFGGKVLYDVKFPDGSSTTYQYHELERITIR